LLFSFVYNAALFIEFKTRNPHQHVQPTMYRFLVDHDLQESSDTDHARNNTGKAASSKVVSSASELSGAGRGGGSGRSAGGTAGSRCDT
jgi:uncharacterized membrane protein